jgi:hypothetical protein
MLIDPFGRCEGALEVHASLPPGRVVRLPAAAPDADEDVVLNVERSKRSNDRMAAKAKALGMSTREYRRARIAGTLPAWCLVRAPYTKARP